MGPTMQRIDRDVFLHYKKLKSQGEFKSFAEFQRATFRAWQIQNEIQRNMKQIKIKGLPKWF
jgi:hypothetical protein